MNIEYLDHFVLTVQNIEQTCNFYQQVLGMEVTTFGNRKALKFGKQKINLHQINNQFSPVAENPTVGSGDFCLITTTPLTEIIAHCERLGVAIISGIVKRTGANGTINSIYIRDPDGNLIEIANY